ncbi:VTT domain-containing protein [soil metagenome]
MDSLQTTLHTFKEILNVEHLIRSYGYIGVFSIIFAETGLMLGFFLPGDSLLITAGIFAEKGSLNIVVLASILFLAATLGNLVGYSIGKHLGKRLFSRDDSRFFHKKHLEMAQSFYQKRGKSAIIIARFMPIIRTFAPVVAGITQMHYPTFVLYSIIGSLLWAVGLSVAGFFLGRYIPDKYFELVVLIVIFVSLLPGLYELLKHPENRKKLYHHTRRIILRRKDQNI